MYTYDGIKMFADLILLTHGRFYMQKKFSASSFTRVMFIQIELRGVFGKNTQNERCSNCCLVFPPAKRCEESVLRS